MNKTFFCDFQTLWATKINLSWVVPKSRRSPSFSYIQHVLVIESTRKVTWEFRHIFLTYSTHLLPKVIERKAPKIDLSRLKIFNFAPFSLNSEFMHQKQGFSYICQRDAKIWKTNRQTIFISKIVTKRSTQNWRGGEIPIMKP